MTPSISFPVIDVDQPMEITGKFRYGMAAIQFKGSRIELVLKGFTIEQLGQLQVVAKSLSDRLLRAP